MDLQEILPSFGLSALGSEVSDLGNGHINETHLVKCADSSRYVLQKINVSIFTRPFELMENVFAVTSHIRRKTNDPRSTLTFLRCTNGQPLFVDKDGGHWRMYHYIDNVVCLDAAESLDDFYQSAVGFGNFQKQLSDFPADTLAETIPNFHNTADRYVKFKEAIRADKAGRAAQVQEEIRFYLDREEDGTRLCRLQASGELPLRVTHNDTKLNNVMLDAATRKAQCVIDLDTVMPGLSVNDFGDSIRFGASTAAEDEPDLDKVWMSLDLYRTYAEGFLSACGDSLTQAELDNMAQGAKVMTLECGMRFLTDYLDGDCYFRIHRPGQNLDRARTHIKLVSDMESKWDEMNRVIHELAGR